MKILFSVDEPPKTVYNFFAKPILVIDDLEFGVHQKLKN